MQGIELSQTCRQCESQCPGWMPHLWRKKCVSCECPMSFHVGCDPDVISVKSLTLKDTRDESKLVQKYDWFPSDANPDLVELYMKSLPSEYVPAKGTPGALWRVQQYTRQLPPYDFDCGACHKMADLEKRRLVKFVDKRRDQCEGRGRVCAASVEVKCADCSMEILPGEVHVVTERLGPDKTWHPRCFKCAECRELLVDLTYFTNDQQTVYCGRHHGELNIKRCAGCDELIFANTFTHAEGKDWHKEHFCCSKCDEPLQDRPYDAHDDSIYCSSCYSKYAVLCHKCSKPIGLGRRKKVTVGDKSWHDTCFACTRCRKDLQQSHYFNVNDALLCDECMEPVTQCYKCKKGISKAMSFLSHNSRSWHAECFKCVLCHNWLIDGQFHDYDDDLMCSRCYAEKVGKRCGTCAKPIVGKVVQHGLSAYHPECFRCAGCGCSFDGGGKVREKEGKPYCQQCAADFATKCSSCRRPIAGKHTVYNRKPYHLECFVCSKCGTSVGKGTFYEASDGTVLCAVCADR